MMSPASPALSRVLTGTSTPPAVSRPNAAMIHSAELGAQMATRSPLPTPADAKAPAATRTRPASSAKLSRSGPSTTASASPKRSAELSTISGMVCQVMCCPPARPYSVPRSLPGRSKAPPSLVARPSLLSPDGAAPLQLAQTLFPARLRGDQPGQVAAHDLGLLLLGQL